MSRKQLRHAFGTIGWSTCCSPCLAVKVYNKNIVSLLTLSKISNIVSLLLLVPRLIRLHFNSSHLDRELSTAHHFNDVEGGPADVIAQHLEL